MVVVVVLDFGCLRCVWGLVFLCFVLGIRLVDLVFCFGVCGFLLPGRGGCLLVVLGVLLQCGSVGFGFMV